METKFPYMCRNHVSYKIINLPFEENIATKYLLFSLCNIAMKWVLVETTVVITDDLR